MKKYLTIFVPLVVLALVFAVGFFVVPAVESPQAKLDRQIDEQVELAQRMLYQYNAQTPNLRQVFEAAATQPADIDANKWRAYLDMEENTPFASVREQVLGQEQRLRQAAQRIDQLSGDQTPPKPLAGSEEAYRQVLDELKSSNALLDQAIGIVRNAIDKQEEGGAEPVSGRTHPAATRLQAILLRHKADLYRREAALVRAKADLDRKRVERLAVVADEIQEQAAAQKIILAGGTAPGKSAPVAAPAAATPAATTPGATTRPANEPANSDTASEQPSAAKKPAPGFWGAISGLADKAAPHGPSEPQAPNKAEPAPAPPKPEVAVAEPQSQPEPAAGPAEVVPALPERIAALKKNRTDVEARITAGQAAIEALNKQIEVLEARRVTAENQARQAELKMLEAEQKGAKSTDPEAVQAFVNEYRKLSEAQRQASREAATLQEGSMRNGRAASSDPEEILASPIVAADASKPIEAERGLAALKNDKLVAEAALKANQQLLAEIDQQISGLNARRETVEERLSKLQAARKELAAKLTECAASAVLEAIRADHLEKQAVEVAETEGMKAAADAQSAIRGYQTKTAQFIRSENPTDTPDRKLTEMAGDQFPAAHAIAVQGDLYYALARTYAQQASDLELHQQMLARLAALGIAIKLDPQKLPEGVSADAVPAAATSADEAGKAVAEARKKAVEAARQALDQYTQAATQAKDLWVVHTNIAAIHSMLADLPKAEGDTEDHIALARQTYARAIQGRENRPDYAAYRQILENLKTQTPPGTP